MSFQQGLSGLNASSKNLEIIGNNIANSNTYGAKVSRAEFSDVYASALNGAGSNSVGIGTNLAAVAQQFTQGAITTSDNPMDLAINGAGFFQVTDGKSPVQYSRNGQFKVDRDGFIVNAFGKQLMGYAADDLGVIQPGQSVPLRLPTGGIAPKQTEGMKIEMNLKSGSEIKTAALNFDNPDTYNNATSLTLFDQKGQEVPLTYYFRKTAENTWDLYATADGTSVRGTNAAPQRLTQLVFNNDGTLRSPADPALVDVPIPATTTSNGAQTVAFTPIPQLNVLNATQYGSAFSVTDLSQDGFAAGQLSAIVVEGNGIIMARYSNGRTSPAGQIEVATFRNPQGLQPSGSNAWSRTFASGEPVTGVPGDGSLGVLQAGALEESNVDLTGELVQMITAQRIYQANAQTIKAQDQVLQTLVNLR